MPNFEHEIEARQQFGSIIAGIDEAGRGPLVGSVFAAAVVLPQNFSEPMLDDSKKLSEKKRDYLYERITQDPDIAWAVASVNAQKIDEINILQATHLAMRTAAATLLEKLPEIHGFLIDGSPVKTFPYPNQNLVKGDSKSLSIAAASIIAKVSRDEEMYALDRKHPEYGFAQHKGYGTKAHMAALNAHGLCAEHRLSFAPCRKIAEGQG